MPQNCAEDEIYSNTQRILGMLATLLQLKNTGKKVASYWRHVTNYAAKFHIFQEMLSHSLVLL